MISLFVILPERVQDLFSRSLATDLASLTNMEMDNGPSLAMKKFPFVTNPLRKFVQIAETFIVVFSFLSF